MGTGHRIEVGIGDLAREIPWDILGNIHLNIVDRLEVMDVHGTVCFSWLVSWDVSSA